MKKDKSNPDNFSGRTGNIQQNSRNGNQPDHATESFETQKGEKVDIKQQQYEKHIAIVRFWAVFRDVLGDIQVWQLAAHAINLRPNNLFYMFNHPYLAAGIGVVNFMAFWFSIGLLALPDDMFARREGRTVTLMWSNYSTSGGCSPDDELVLGYFYDSNPEAPQVIRDTKARRKDGWMRVDIPVNNDPEGETLHIYPFFCSKDMLRFSRNYYFKI